MSIPYLIDFTYRGTDRSLRLWADSPEDAMQQLRVAADAGKVIGSQPQYGDTRAADLRKAEADLALFEKQQAPAQAA